MTIAGDKPEIPKKEDRLLTIETVQELTDKAHRLLIDNLQGFDNRISRPHANALFQICAGFSSMAGRVCPAGRNAYPLFAGGGKTQAIVAWTATANAMGLFGNPLTLAVSASRVEALCDLKRDLVKNGVPEEAIGLLHSYSYQQLLADAYLRADGELKQGYASEPSTEDATDRPILLCSHNLIKGPRGLADFYQYQGQDRSLLIWDESLLRASCRGLQMQFIKSGPKFREDYVSNEIQKEAVEYVREAIEVADAKIKSKSTETFTLPRLTSDRIFAYKEVFYGPIERGVRDLLEVSQADLRIVTGQQDSAVIQYSIVIPEELERIIILDASFQIRELCRIDLTISDKSDNLSNIVSYENVTINQIRHAAGRDSITRAFHGSRDLVKEYVDIVKRIPGEEAVLFFTFIPRTGRDDRTGVKGVDFMAFLETALRRAGIDTNEHIEVDGEEKPRFCWLNHGSETSLSRFNYCKNLIWVGVLHRSNADMAASIAGQEDNLQADLNSSRVHKLIVSEVVYRLHQGICRGSCRVVQDGIAGRMKVWLTYKKDDIREPLGQVMHGLRWSEFEPKHLSELTQTKTEKIAEVIRETLSQYSESILGQGMYNLVKISTRKLKTLAGLEDCSSSTFTRAMEMFLDETSDWALEGRSLVMMSAAYYGFTDDTCGLLWID